MVSHARLWTKWSDPRGRPVTGIGGAEQHDRQTSSQEIKHEPEEERPFLKPVGQSTEQQVIPTTMPMASSMMCLRS